MDQLSFLVEKVDPYASRKMYIYEIRNTEKLFFALKKLLYIGHIVVVCILPTEFQNSQCTLDYKNEYDSSYNQVWYTRIKQVYQNSSDYNSKIDNNVI